VTRGAGRRYISGMSIYVFWAEADASVLGCAFRWIVNTDSV
jgi:hypothetical protein